jgi:GntR family transcriptional regulator / MocR family aminotransferase
LRIGYLVVPEDLVDRFLAARFALDIGPATFQQAVLADFIAEGHFARHIRRMRSVYAERRNALIENLGRQFGTAAKVMGADAGMHLSVMLDGICDQQISKRAAQQKLWLVPLSPFYLMKNARQGFILGFGSTSVEEMPSAVHKIRKLLGPRTISSAS